MFSIKQSKATGCIGNFMQNATRAQVPNVSRRVGQAFPSYGYQTWIGNFRGRSSYWWVGYGGQRVGIDPESERIIVITSWREDYMADVYKLWGSWN
jgi:CubicO group peptidase (beta-lactamase class C family)